MIKERYVGECKERDHHAQRVMEMKEDLCTATEIMKSMEYLVGLRDFKS